MKDTTEDAAEVQRAVYRRLGGSGRVALAIELSEMTRALALDGIRRRNPGMTEAQAIRELIWHLHGVPRDEPR